MKKWSLLFLAFISLTTTAMMAQNTSTMPVSSVSVSGSGKVSIVPDQVVLTLGVISEDADASVAKTQNDKAIAKVLLFLKSLNIPVKDYQTRMVDLNRNQNYQTKEITYVASQDIVITLNDIKQYEPLILGAMNQGVNSISNVTFKTSKASELERQARVLAVKDAQTKASDYANALGQKLGKALQLQEGGSDYRPAPRLYAMKMQSADAVDQTLAIGEIEISSSISVSFELK
ncbi:SIMPL domain-containing protein [Myroides sp. LJL115]